MAADGSFPAVAGPVEDLPLPYNIEAEQALLGVLLFDNGAIERVEGLEPRHFFEPLHVRLFEVTERLISQGKVAEPIVLMEKFKNDPAFEDLGGLRYLADLIDRAPPSVNARDYADVVIDLGLRREIVLISRNAMALVAGDAQTSAREHLETIEGQLFDLAEGKAGGGGGFQDFNDVVDDALAAAEAAFRRDGSMGGLSTGLIDLDQKLGGLHPSDLLILAGRPSMGKTALATNVAFHVARNYAAVTQPDGTVKTMRGGRVGFFSLEMSAEQLAQRIIAERSGISGDRIRKGQINADDFARYRDAANELREIPLHIDATGGISIAKLCQRARRLRRRKGLDLIVIDYLQLATGSDKGRGSNRVQEITEITSALKALAKELNVPVLALSQLSRQVESRDDKRPQLSDLRESGSIEQDADAVMFVYRDEYYVGRTEPAMGSIKHDEWQTQMEAVRGVAEVIIGKQRHGPIGTVKLKFEAKTTKFSDLPRESITDHLRLPYGEEG